MNTALAVFTIVLSLFPLRAIVVAQENSSGDETSRHLAHAEELFEQGHSAESKQICESLLKTSPDGATAQRAFALNLLSKIYALQGDYDRAIAFAQRSADTYQRAGDQNGEAHAFNNKGIAELQNGSYSAAQPDLEKALVLSQNVHDLENQVQIQNNLGSAYFFRGSYSEAMRNYEQALSLVNGNSSAKWSGYWLQITKFNQATLLQRLGRYENALHAYREVETSSKTLTGDDRAHLYANLGTLYRRLGDPYKALDMYRAAQQLYLTQHDADGEIAVLKNSGIANALDLEDAKQAASIFRSVLALAVKTHNRREEMQAHLYLGETLFRAGSLSPARKEFEQTNSLARELATAEEQWKSLYGLGRIEASAGNIDTAERDYREAISLIEQTRGQLQLAALRSEFFADKREVYDALILILIKKNELDESFLFLERSRSRNFQDSLQKNQGGAPLTLQHVQTSLPPATLLLEFWTAGNETAVVWCTRDAAGIQTRQLTAEQQEKLQAALKRMPESLEDPDEKTIFDEVLPTDWRFPRDVRHLLIVADAWISSLPFELLHTPDDSKSLLVDRYDISYLPSAALLRRNIADRHVYWPWNRELVAFGDPVVKTSEITNGKQDAAPLNEQSIPYSREEIDEIAHLTPGATKIFLRENDLKKTFMNGTANSAFILHVSTHAFADGDSPENSRLLFSSDGADASPSYVYLRELYDLDLSGVKLVTISACDTERGKIIRGEGVQAFSRALISAGAQASATSLWRVDDQPTAEFMRLFYDFLMKEHKSKAEALRLAKLKFFHSNSKLNRPAVWAAFVLNGDGLTPLPNVISWTELVASVVLPVVFLVVLVLSARYIGNRNLRS